MKEEVTQIMKDGESVGPWRFSVALSGPVDPYPCWKIYSLAGNSNQKPIRFFWHWHTRFVCLKCWRFGCMSRYGIMVYFLSQSGKPSSRWSVAKLGTLSYGGCINTFVHWAADEHLFLHPSYIGMRTPGDSMGFDSYRPIGLSLGTPATVRMCHGVGASTQWHGLELSASLTPEFVGWWFLTHIWNWECL